MSRIPEHIAVKLLIPFLINPQFSGFSSRLRETDDSISTFLLGNASTAELVGTRMPSL